MDNHTFIEKAKLVHGDLYDYSACNYNGAKNKIKIICIEHGEFTTTPTSHLSKRTGCPTCVKTTLRFLNKIKPKFYKKHRDKYDYSKVEYRGGDVKVIITCPEHGDFEQTPHSHLKGYGCQRCGAVQSNKLKRVRKIRNKFEGLIQPEEYKLIPLTQGKYAKVDNEDFEKLKNSNWNCTVMGYARNHKLGLMHRFIMNCPEGMVVDHINHDTLDNRKSNLRKCTHANNIRSQIPRVATSIYKGVYWDKKNGQWAASITKNYKKKFLGYFCLEVEAALAYNKAAYEMFGQFSILNKI